MTYIYIIPFTPAWYVTIAIFAGSLLSLLVLCGVVPMLWKRRIVSFLGYFLLFDLLFYLGYMHYHNTFSLQTSLPLTFCAVMQLCAGIAALFRNKQAYEICLFFGITGPVQAFLTPAVVYSGEEYILIDFFLAHGLTVAVPLLMTFCLGYVPRKGSVFRALALMQMAVGGVYFANSFLGANYMYLMEKPAVAHPLNSGPHGYNVVLWHLYFYLIAYGINALFVIKQKLGEKTTDKILQ